MSENPGEGNGVGQMVTEGKRFGAGEVFEKGWGLEEA
jgi:hypothetical protein